MLNMMLKLLCLCVLSHCLIELVVCQLNEYGRKYDTDSSERYDADGDLSIPENAQGRPEDVIFTRNESEADRRRKNAPAKYEDERSLCYCNYEPEFCGGFTNHTCMKHTEAACFHFTEEVYNEDKDRVETAHLFGCAPLTRGSGGSYFTCKAHLVAHATPKSIACCYEGAYCNYNLTVPPYINVSPDGFIVHREVSSRLIALLIAIVGLIWIAIVVLILICWKHNPFVGWLKRIPLAQRLKPALNISTLQSADKSDFEKSPMLMDMSSGSGSGLASLNQRTVAQDLEIISVIGKGRYGEVKKALYKGDRYVAVKTFYTTEEDSWKNEKEIYQTQMLNHENILQFVAADIGSEDSITRMLLITDFHKFGSLYEYLQRGETLSVSEALSLAHSAVCGLEHLHSALRGTGTPQKPAIAHRDIKSKNIIVKREGVCCVADFGLALSEDMLKTRTNINIQVGTKRYMAPEVLDKSLNVRNFYHFKMADIYSFSLVVWEILRRIQENTQSVRVSESDSGIGSSASGSGSGCGVGARYVSPRSEHGLRRNASSGVSEGSRHIDDSISVKARPAVQPFEGMVDSDPSFEQMRRLVCVHKQRPLLEESWMKDPYLKDICDLMTECWSDNINCRHTALRMKRKIMEVLTEHNKMARSPTSLMVRSDTAPTVVTVETDLPARSH
uniref:receptor protein serine/threonine kinase n=1 Tax=Ascaris suum TaxID=6253 RepID=F1KXX2_ASCSU